MLQARGGLLATVVTGAAVVLLLSHYAVEVPRLTNAPPAAAVTVGSTIPPLPSAQDFPGLDWGTQLPLRVLAEVNGAADADASTVRCLGDAPDDRTCRLHNACLDTSDDTLVVFGGHDESVTPVEVSLVDGSKRRLSLATEKPLVFTGATRTELSGLDLRVRKGTLPPGQIATWLDAPHVIFSRSAPATSDAVLEEFFSVWWLLTRWVGWERQSVGVLWWDRFRGGSAEVAEVSAQRFSQWFPDVAEVSVEAARSLAQPGQPLVCFRSLVVGAGGYSVLRNAAAAFSPERTFPESPSLAAQYATYRAAHAEFSAYALTVFGLPSKASVQADFERNRTLGDVLLLVGGGSTRKLSNVAKLEEGLRTVSGGRVVRVLAVDALPPRDLVRALLHADAALAVHGVGTAAPLFMRPGTAFIDLLPPRATAAQPALVGLALRLGVRPFTVPVREQDCAAGTPVLDQEQYAADVDATRALVALAVGHEP